MSSPRHSLIECAADGGRIATDEARSLGATRILKKHEIHRLPVLLGELFDASGIKP